MGRFLRLSLFFVLLLGFAFGLEFFWTAGQLRRIDDNFVGRCTAVPGVTGAEDITIHPRTKVAYVSAYDRGAAARGTPVSAGIYAYDLKARKPALRNLTPAAPATFRPHGLSLWLGGKGEPDLLFVINHPEDRHEVQIFEITAKGLALRETIVDPLIAHPNDLVAVDAKRFYVTNDLNRDFGTLGGKLEVFLRLPYSDVVYYDGERARAVADNIAYPNGINASRDGRTVFVASLLMKQINVYDRDAASGDLEAREVINLDGNPDNVELDDQGNLWVGAHPQLVTLFLHSREATGQSLPLARPLVSLVQPLEKRGGIALAPSQVLRIASQKEEECRPVPSALGRILRALGFEQRVGSCYTTQAIYQNRGAELSGASVAAVSENRMLIGSIFDDHILDCRPSVVGGWGA
jgi:arylesterase / paraoxonase